MFEVDDIVRVKPTDTVPAVFKGYIGIVRDTDFKIIVEFNRTEHNMITHHFKADEIQKIGRVTERGD